MRPFHVAAWIEDFPGSKPTIKQKLAAVRMLYDFLVVRQITPSNPAHSVRGPKYVVKKGKTPVWSREDAYNKPIVIVECGVTGTKDYQLGWLSEAKRDLANFPLVEALIYFNAKDTPGAWGKQYATPDWRVSGCDLADVFGANS